MADPTNNVTKDWNSVLSTAQAGMDSIQQKINTAGFFAQSAKNDLDSITTALANQKRFYQEAIEKYRPRPAYEEIIPLQEAYQKDPTNPAKKAAWEKALSEFNSESAKFEEETGLYPGIISSFTEQKNRASERFKTRDAEYNALINQENQYKQQISEAQAQLAAQKSGTTPANTTTVSATTVPASDKPGNPAVATTTTSPAIIAADKPLIVTSAPLEIDEIGIDGLPTGKKLIVEPPTTTNPSNSLPLGNDIEDIYDPNLTPEQIASLNPGDQKARAAGLKGSLSPDEIVVTGEREKEDYAAIYSAESQATEQDQANFKAKEDWRVRLSLAPDSQYLYNDPEYAGILKPLKGTDGVIFPYTPSITVNYAANYEATNIVHSNYKIYQYSGSAVEQVTIACDFTCQDTYEANYLLAVIHFFRSMTKMFYGQDTLPKNGTPPPLCYMFGMGGYQFAAHPLAISGFSYNLPADVDYIKTTSASPAGAPVADSADIKATRLAGTNVSKGGTGPGPKFNAGVGNETVSWVPTKIQLSITCLPIMSRNAISNQFSLKRYGSGDLVLGTRKLGGGMW